MALQTQRRTKSSKKRRASHFALKKQNLAECSKCGKPVQPHHACNSCGTYKKIPVLKIKNKKREATKKTKAEKK